MISTSDLSGLPDSIETLQLLTPSLAMLDAILEPEWEMRYFSFNSKWGDGEQMASMRNGSGDEWFLLFTNYGAILKGFAHESPMSPYRVDPPQVWPGIYDGVPTEFSSFLAEPAFSIDDATFCIWLKARDAVWRRGTITFPPGDDPDGSADLLEMLDGNPQTYRLFAESNWEVELDLAFIRRIYAHEPISETIVRELNPNRTLGDLEEDLEEIGYPADGS